MISPEQFERSLAIFPSLQRADRQIANEFQHATYFVSLPTNKVVFAEGDYASALALLLSGTVRVYKAGKTGREITLYRFSSGESCILTVSAILNNQLFPANAIVEQAAEAVMIPEQVFRDWAQRYPLWREFVFNLLSVRLTNVLTLVDDLVFRRMDARTASFLLQRSQTQNQIAVTHKEIAAELGSSREVISRILEGMAASGVLRSTRGMLEILDFEALNQLSLV